MTIIDQCENCSKYFECEVAGELFEQHLCHECFNAWPVYIDSDTENKI